MIGEHALRTQREGAVVSRIAVARRIIVDIGTDDVQHAERALPERAFNFQAAVEDADRRRIKHRVAAEYADRRKRVDVLPALREERPVLLIRLRELLQLNGGLILLDVREI